jgi:hypothetical protein
MEQPFFENLGNYYVTKIEEAIKKFLGLKDKEENLYSKFCKTLLDTGSVIYNQLVLNAISPFNDPTGSPYKPTRLYIYATYTGAVAINDFIKTEMSEIIQATNQSVDVDGTIPFKHSIDRNKGVKAKLLYKNRRNPYFLSLKIVDDIPSNVVSKEEFTFLQTLFDGKKVKSIHTEDVINKEGSLNEEYLPLVGWDERDKEFDREYGGPYADLLLELYINSNFQISYDTKSAVIGYVYLYGKEVSGEEHLISYLHRNLVNVLVNDRFKKMVDIGHGENKDITVADIYLRWFYLKKPTMNEFMKIIKRLASEGKFLLPLWIQDTYKKDDDIIKALIVNTCSLERYFLENVQVNTQTKDTRKTNEFAAQVIKDIESEPEHNPVDYLKNPKIKALLRIIKKLILQEYIELTSEYTYETDDELLKILLRHKTELSTFFSDYRYKNKEIQEFAMDFLVKINIDTLSEEIAKYEEIYNQYYKKIRKGSIEELVKIFKNYEEIAKYEKYMSEKEDKERLKSNTRNIPALNIVKASRINTVDYDEKNRMIRQKCTDASTHSLYDMNRYLKGKMVRGYTMDGIKNREQNLQAVNQKEAMKRLIFFLAESTDLTELKPYCYNLDRLTEDIGSILTVECKDFETYDGLQYLFGHNPIIRLNFEYAVYVPLSEILDAIYNTKNQVFILIPTEKSFRYTASMAVQFRTPGSGVSTDHCQEGSKKQLHTIKVCKGSKENACWPVNEAIELNEVSPDIYYMKQKFYVWSKSENSMSEQFKVANDVNVKRLTINDVNTKRAKRRADGEENVSDDEEIQDPWWSSFVEGYQSLENQRSRSVSPLIPRSPISPISPISPLSFTQEDLRSQPVSPRSPFSEVSTYDDDANAESIREQNIPRSAEEIREYMITTLPPWLRDSIGEIPDIIAESSDNSYTAADRMIYEIISQYENDPNIGRNEEEIRFHLNNIAPADLRYLINDISHIIALNPPPNNSYSAAERMFNETVEQNIPRTAEQI